eukprot:Gb_06457 [translate_table: standard]
MARVFGPAPESIERKSLLNLNYAEDFREEIADSDHSYVDWNDFSLGRFRSAKCVPEDAQSSTSDNSWDEERSDVYSDEGESFPQSYISFLQQASDDELGLPPNPQIISKDELQPGFIGDLDVRPLDLDFDMDMEFNEESVLDRDHQHQSSFWEAHLRC